MNATTRSRRLNDTAVCGVTKLPIDLLLDLLLNSECFPEMVRYDILKSHHHLYVSIINVPSGAHHYRRFSFEVKCVELGEEAPLTFKSKRLRNYSGRCLLLQSCPAPPPITFDNYAKVTIYGVYANRQAVIPSPSFVMSGYFIESVLI